MSNYSITIKNEDFRKLTEALSVISSFLTDVDIRKGKVRQFNLSKTLILDLDMTSIFNEDLCASNIKAKLPIFEIMANDGKDVTIRKEEIKVTKGGMENTMRFWFLDNEVSLFRYRWTDSNKLSTKYISDTEWSTVLKDANQNNFITKITLEDKPDLVRKIKKVCDTFNAGGVAFRNDTTGYSLQVESNDKIANAKLYADYTPLNLTKTFKISANVDFITDGVVKSISYYKPGTGDQKIEKSSSWMIADCSLNDKISFKTYTICSTVVGDLEPGKPTAKPKKKQEPVNSHELTESAIVQQQVVPTSVPNVATTPNYIMQPPVGYQATNEPVVQPQKQEAMQNTNDPSSLDYIESI